MKGRDARARVRARVKARQEGPAPARQEGPAPAQGPAPADITAPVDGPVARREEAVLTERDARRMEACVGAGGVAVFPTDTVYGVCCDPEDERAVSRLYELKGRPPERPAAVMFFSRTAAINALAPLTARERETLEKLLPGPVTLLLANHERRFPLACGPEPATLGLRVPLLSDRLAALGSIAGPVMQSSANLSGEPDARCLHEVPHALRDGADLTLDAGELPGVASTVLDLREYAHTGKWTIVRTGAMERATVERALS